MKLFWKFYSILFFAIVLSNALQLLNKNSLFGVYYNTTIVFSNWFVVPYFLNILNSLIACIVSIFIFGYAFDVQVLSSAPPWLFYIRLLSDCTGHSYELKMVQSGFSHGKLWVFIGLTSLVLPILPSYIAQWKMTFIKKLKKMPRDHLTPGHSK
jgi:hypothetical protein